MGKGSKSTKSQHKGTSAAGAIFNTEETDVKSSTIKSTTKVTEVLKKKKQWEWIWKPVKNHPIASVMALASIVIGVMATIYSPLGNDEFAKLWYENGGQLMGCNKALAVAMAHSDLACYSKTRRSDGTLDRGLFGFNSKNDASVSDACAYDCKCATQSAVKMLRGKAYEEWPSLPEAYTLAQVEVMMVQQASTPCNKVAEQLIKSGTMTMYDIAG